MSAPVANWVNTISSSLASLTKFSSRYFSLSPRLFSVSSDERDKIIGTLKKVLISKNWNRYIGMVSSLSELNRVEMETSKVRKESELVMKGF